MGLYGARRWRRHRQPATRAAGAAATARALDPALVIRRDVMRSIFGEVMVSNHGRISLVATLETLAAQLGRCGSSLVRLTDTGPRARRAIEDFLEFDRDALQEILVKATAVHFEPARVDAMRASLARIEEHLHALLDAELAPAVVDRLHPRLGRDVARLEGEFRAFYRELEGHFTCDFADILARVLDRYTDLAQQQRITIVTEPDRTRREPVLVEAAALRLTLDNLVGNAIRAMREGQGHRLHIGWRADRGQLVVRVTDTGCGIGPDRVDDLFSGRASTRPGGGVGLARSRRLLGHTGGVIELERSVPGQGSTFRLRLPRPVIATAQHDQEGATA
jgi:signal transduction histidine kinase